MRVPYSPNPPQVNTAEEQAIVERIRARRSPDDLWKLDLALLHSPPIADAFNTFAGSIRNNTTLPADLRETAFLTVASLCYCWYEWDIHVPIARAAGVSEQGIQCIVTGIGEKPFLTEHQDAVRNFATQVSLPACGAVDHQIGKLTEFLDEKQIVELTACVAGFNLVCRFISALDVGEKNGRDRLGNRTALGSTP